MNKSILKILSGLLYFWSKEKRKIFRGKYDKAAVYITKLRKRGISVGYGTFIAPGVRIRDKRTVIGKYCSIARDVTIGTGQHPLDTLTTHSMVHSECYTGEGHIGFLPENRVTFDRSRPVHVGNDVWIGLGAVIMDGVTIGDGAVIGTYSVVTKDVPPYAIVVGIPGRVLRYRFDDNTIARLQKTRWFDRNPEFIRTLPPGDVEILENAEVQP